MSKVSRTDPVKNIVYDKKIVSTSKPATNGLVGGETKESAPIVISETNIIMMEMFLRGQVLEQ